MRPLARQGARLTSQARSSSCSRIRQSSIPRSWTSQQARCFQSGAPRSSDSRPPSITPEHDAWLEQQREAEGKNGAQPNQTAAEETTNPEAVETKSNGEGRKPGMRRTMRRRPATDVPKPPPIPDWFLKHNVKLLKDQPTSSIDGPQAKEVLRCVDASTGHTLFTVPYYEPSMGSRGKSTPAVREESNRSKPRIVAIGGKEVDVSTLGESTSLALASQEESKREEPFVRALVTMRARSPDEVDLEALGELLVSLPEETQRRVLREEAAERERSGREDVLPAPQLGLKRSPAKKKDLGKNFFDQKVSMQSDATVGHEESRLKAAASAEASSSLYNGDASKHPYSWLFLETQTSIAASLALAGEGQNVSSFASSRVDLSLHCPDSDSHDQMDVLVEDIARSVNADIIRLDANDFEELTGEYVGHGRDSPGSFSTLGYDVFDGYHATNAADRSAKPFGTESEDQEEFDEDDFDDEDEDVDEIPGGGGFGNIEDLRNALHARRHDLQRALQGAGIAVHVGTPKMIQLGGDGNAPMRPAFMRSPAPSEFIQWEDTRLDALLDRLLDAAKQKREATTSTSDSELADTVGRGHERPQQAFGNVQKFRATSAEVLTNLLGHRTSEQSTALRLDLQASSDSTDNASNPMMKQRTIVHVRDLKDICRSRLGDAVVKRLVRLVRKRRIAGESIIVVGTTAQAINTAFMSSPHEAEDFPFRSISFPPVFDPDPSRHSGLLIQPLNDVKKLTRPAYNRILEINLRHIQSMVRRLCSGQDVDLLAKHVQEQMDVPGTHVLTERVLSLDQVQRVVLGAIGLSQTHAKSEVVQPMHIAMATSIMTMTEHIVKSWAAQDRKGKLLAGALPGRKSKAEQEQPGAEPGMNKLDEIRSSCNQHESRLLTGVVDANNIKVGFNDVHAPPETIDALKTLTSLSLLRPDAFKYGVLSTDRLPGLLLYGPPGTGKTMLAKAVAKESQATVMEVSGAQIYEKYVGEGEKMVRAIFTLARKISKKVAPCIVFIDEADAIFGSRNSAGNRNTHREIINEFLKNWDGIAGTEEPIYVMVATNRPFDLDDAVLRRLPRRLLVDLPVAKDREAILNIHLKNELLDNSVSLNKLAEQTPLYSGSDLKNLCVSAALAAVKEENESAALHKNDKDFKLPEKRTLTSTHFDKAIAEISASISEDMRTMTALKDFDAKYGDRRGRAKKPSYGFGASDTTMDESSVRVKQPSQTPPP